MSVSFRTVVLALVSLSALSCTGPGKDGVEGSPAEVESREGTIDLRSYRLGSIGAFAEMVGAGVKKLALSAPMTPAEVDALLSDAERIAGENGAEIHVESDFLVTDLFSAELTAGKQVLVICLEESWREYQELKEEKLRLQEEGTYEGEAREGIARRFGALLSYSEERIDALLSGSI